MNWRKGSLLSVLVVLAFTVVRVSWALTFGGHQAVQNVEQIDQLNTIIGTYGGEGTGTTAGREASGYYGHHCAGTCCPEKTQNKAAQSNLLKLFVQWEVSDGTDGESGSWTRTVTAEATLTEKTFNQTTADLNAEWCTVGPPTWNATATIDLSSPKKGTAGNTGSGGGTVTSSFTHDPTVSYAYDSNDGAPYTNQTSGVTTVSDSAGWVVDPEDPQTHRFDVSATVKVSFSATAKEVVVVDSRQKAKATLKVIAP